MTLSAELTRIFPALQFGQRMTMNGHALHYIDAGQGQPILCVHGNPTWSYYWRTIIEQFRDSNRVVAVDHLGCGLSDKPQQFDFCLQAHINNLTELVERLDLTRIVLVVHDWGGPIGIGAAIRFADRVERLVVTNTGLFPPPFVPWRIRICRIPGLGTILNRGCNAFARAAVTMATEQPGGLAPEVRRGMLAPYDSWANRIAIDRFVQDIPLSPHHRSWKLLEQIDASLPSLAVKPCLLLWGMRDWCFRPSILRILKQRFPAAQCIEFSDAGHYLMEDASGGVVSAMRDFLSQEFTTPPEKKS